MLHIRNSKHNFLLNSSAIREDMIENIEDFNLTEIYFLFDVK